MYNNAAWRRLRAQVLAEEPTCQLQLEGCTGRSTQAAHVLSVAERPDLFLERSNVVGACRSCNHREASAKGGRARR
jgi:5-methylcytosine-specific restriction endonuclease McrA